MTHKLLLADDSITIQRVIELTFADEDVQVIVVSDGKQAIDRVQVERPDIVLADIGMPERDGYEVAAFIKGNPQLASIPVVLLTGAFEPIDENRARSVGCDGVLVKPFEPQMVINRVKELLARHRSVAAPAAPLSRAPAPSRTAHAPGSVDFDPDLRLPPRTSAPARSPVEFDSDLAPAAGTERPKDEGDSLEDYFDRLDAAFANIETVAPKAAPVFARADPAPARPDLPQPPVERPPANVEALNSWDADVAAGFAPARQPDLANAFAALLAAEEGLPAPQTAVLPAPGMPSAPATITDDTIEEIVTRVLARMSDESMRLVVIETAERVVREEIDRIKRSSSSHDPRSGG